MSASIDMYKELETQIGYVVELGGFHLALTPFYDSHSDLGDYPDLQSLLMEPDWSFRYPQSWGSFFPAPWQLVQIPASDFSGVD